MTQSLEVTHPGNVVSPLIPGTAPHGDPAEFRIQLERTCHRIQAALNHLPNAGDRMDYLDSLVMRGFSGGSDRSTLSIAGLDASEPEIGSDAGALVIHARNLYALWHLMHESLIGLPDDADAIMLEGYLCDQMLMLAGRLACFIQKHAISGVEELDRIVETVSQPLPFATLERSLANASA
jgi:hypothetical protein